LGQSLHTAKTSSSKPSVFGARLFIRLAATARRVRNTLPFAPGKSGLITATLQIINRRERSSQSQMARQTRWEKKGGHFLTSIITRFSSPTRVGVPMPRFSWYLQGCEVRERANEIFVDVLEVTPGKNCVSMATVNPDLHAHALIPRMDKTIHFSISKAVRDCGSVRRLK
jgi:hypothetical protein